MWRRLHLYCLVVGYHPTQTSIPWSSPMTLDCNKEEKSNDPILTSMSIAAQSPQNSHKLLYFCAK